MGGRIAEGEQGEQLFYGFHGPGSFRPCSLDFLRLIHDNNGVNRLDFPPENPAIFICCPNFVGIFVERLNIHDAETQIPCLNKLGADPTQVIAVIYKTVFFHIHAIQSAKMAAKLMERLFHSFSYGNGGHHDDEFGKPVRSIQLQNGAQIYICFSGSRFHFHRKIPSTLQGSVRKQAVFTLHPLQIGQQPILVGDGSIFPRSLFSLPVYSAKQLHRRLDSLKLIFQLIIELKCNPLCHAVHSPYLWLLYSLP